MTERESTSAKSLSMAPSTATRSAHAFRTPTRAATGCSISMASWNATPSSTGSTTRPGRWRSPSERPWSLGELSMTESRRTTIPQLLFDEDGASWPLASGPMAEAVTHSTSRVTDADITVISTYLKDSGLPSSASKPSSIVPDGGAMNTGAAIHKDSCAVCHKVRHHEVESRPARAGNQLLSSFV